MEEKIVCGCGEITFKTYGDEVFVSLEKEGEESFFLFDKPLSLEGFNEGIYYNVDWFRTMKKAAGQRVKIFPCCYIPLGVFGIEEIEGCLQCLKTHDKFLKEEGDV